MENGKKLRWHNFLVYAQLILKAERAKNGNEIWNDFFSLGFQRFAGQILIWRARFASKKIEA